MSLPKKIAAIVVAAACLIAAVAVSYSIGYQRGAKGRTVLTETAQSEQDGQTEPTEGDDIQPLEEDIISVLCCGVDNTQELTDVIMYAQFDTRSGKVNVLRIPRDTFVGSQFPTAKINAIYGHPEDGKTGIQTLTDYLRDNWKLDIDYYATIDLASVRDIVDDMGGVTMDIQQQINYLPGKVLYPGEQTLTGEQAEWIIRYRAGYANGDLGRIDAQTQFIFSCLDRVHELGRLKCIPILMQHYDDVQTDMTLDKMLSVATALFEVDSDDIQMQVVPGTGTMYYSYAVYAVDEQQLVDILNEDFVSSDGEFTAEKLEVASVYGSGSSNRYNSSQSSQSSSATRPKAPPPTVPPVRTAATAAPRAALRAIPRATLRTTSRAALFISTMRTAIRCTAWMKTATLSMIMTRTATSCMSTSRQNSRQRSSRSKRKKRKRKRRRKRRNPNALRPFLRQTKENAAKIKKESP